MTTDDAPPPIGEALLSRRDTQQKILRCSETTLKVLAREGKLRPVYLGKKAYYKRTELEQFMASLSRESPSKVNA